MWPFNTSDCLIEVSTLSVHVPGLKLYLIKWPSAEFIHRSKSKIKEDIDIYQHDLTHVPVV
jgi:hypothetical protein